MPLDSYSFYLASLCIILDKCLFVSVTVNYNFGWGFSHNYLPTSIGSFKKARGFQETAYFCFIDYAKDFVWIITNSERFLKRQEYQTTYVPPEKHVYRTKSNNRIRHGTSDWFKIGSKYVKTVYCHLVYLTSTQNRSCRMPWLNESRDGIKIAWRNINNFR